MTFRLDFVGEFIPAGSGCLDSIIGLLVMIVLWTVGLLIYGFIKLTIYSTKAAEKGNWGEAIGCWVLILWVILIIVASV